MANLRTLHKRQELRPTQLRSQLRQQKQEQLTSEARIEAIVRIHSLQSTWLLHSFRSYSQDVYFPIIVGCDSNATLQEVEETGWLQTQIWARAHQQSHLHEAHCGLLPGCNRAVVRCSLRPR